MFVYRIASQREPDHPEPESEGGLAVIGARRYPCGGDIGWPDDVPTVALEMLSHCASATTYLLQG